MATKPFFLWGDTHATSTGAPDSDVGVFRSSATQATAAGDAPSAPELGAAAAVARPRLRRADASGPGPGGKKKQQAGAGGGVGANKKPQRGLGVAELERLRCGGDPLLELSTVAGDAAAAAAQGHPMLHYHHPHHRHPHSAFEAAAGARYCSQLLAPAPPGGPVCALHSPPAAAGCQRAPVPPEQQYFRDRWTSRIGGFTSAGGTGADHQHQCQSQSQSQLLPPATLEPEHPSSQSTIWRPAVSSSSCLHTGHRCGICSRVNHPRMRALAENNGGALALAPTTPPDYSIYDLATAMATARQGDAPLADPPAKKEVREIEFFPAASAHHRAGGGGGSGRVSVPDEPAELAAPFSSPYGAAASHTAPQLDLSLRL